MERNVSRSGLHASTRCRGSTRPTVVRDESSDELIFFAIRSRRNQTFLFNGTSPLRRPVSRFSDIDRRRPFDKNNSTLKDFTREEFWGAWELNDRGSWPEYRL